MVRNENEGLAVIPGFNEVQFEGFCRFIDQGLREELSKFPKIEDINQEIEFQLFGETYQLVEPLIKERDAVYESLTYSSEFYVSAGLICKGSRDMQEQTIFIGNIPLMNSLGTSIVNGIYRIVINQILRSPGIYYRAELDYKGILVYVGTIISDWGGRVELQIDRKRRMWVRVSRKQKISILVLSSAMGLNLKEILENVCYPEFFLAFLNDTEKEKMGSKENAILEFYLQFTCEEPVCFESLCKELQKKFFKYKCELGRIGRLNMNQRLNLHIPHNNTFLLPRDILAAADHLIEMTLLGMHRPSDMNHLKNKRIRSVADLLQDQFGLALVRLENVVKRTLSEAIAQKFKATPKNLLTSIPLTTTYESFFGLHPLSQVLDQTNPLSQIFHVRRLSFLGPGGLTTRTANFGMRNIHPSHYGRICPIDTSEGINAGLIGSLTIHAKIGHWGSLESPFFEISEGSTKARMLSLSSTRDEYYMITTGNSLAVNGGAREEQVVSVQHRQEFLTIAWEQVHLRSFSPFQYFSIGVCLIPFIEHNDATRALMSSNMQRQAVPLVRSEKCIVGTGLERQVARDSGVTAIAEHAGKIISTDIDKILLSRNRYTFSIPLVVYQRSNKNTCMHQKTQVQPGKFLKKGQVLADGASTVGGELALGKNILVAYMPWEGYNFEDAVLISERLVYEDILTSFSIRKYEIQTHVTSEGSEKITNEIPYLEAHLLRNLDKNGIVMLGSWVETGDILVGKLTPQMASYSPEYRLLEAIFGFQVSTSKETCLKLPIGGRGRVIDVRWIQKKEGETIRVYILQKREIKVGDKVAGRHGNKGVISLILPRQDMPYLQDGGSVDMVFNPLGVPSRMNVGQIFECSLGLAGSLLDRHYRIAPLDERYEQEASRKLAFSELYEASKQTSNPWVFEPEYPGKSRIFDGRTGDSFEQPILIGRPYILKLIHQVADKIHARSSGPYSLVTQQPLKGRSKKGGQRVGEMEVWALEGFGVSHILQEMLTIKSDHITTRQEVLGTTISGRIIPKPKAEDAPESFRLLVRELRSLSLELKHFLISEKNFQITSKVV
uniref:DNA-directed RNA polymerase subunit beta n=1 Tax=Passiflora costaricensis TaxID=1129466 RepID=A0A7G7CLK4_9ROSI|nr:RNA polymerase beta subunit [Passiflora costaricensis]QNE88470.1 RNA polymerase beta subunit [Passiflora costaricensis]